MSFDLKTCKICHLGKEINEFPQACVKNGKIYYRTVCKECRKPQQHTANQKYYDENKEEIKSYELKKYHNGGKEIRKEYAQNYSIVYRQNPENKLKLNQNSNNWQKKKRANEPSFAIRQNVSRAINATLKIYKSTKNGRSFLQFVPWTLNELKIHLEKQFESWMTWKNRGNYIKSQWDDTNLETWKWNIDHIIPQSDLPYTSMKDDNFKKCWALSNLRPYSAKQNLIDGTIRVRHDKKKVV